MDRVAFILLAAVIASYSRPAEAQVATPDESDDVQSTASPSEVEEIIITGTRILRALPDAGSPVTIVSADNLRETATVNAEDAIRELPMALPGVTAFTNNGNPGAATVNLRGLDDERTLVLVDGRRVVGYDSEGIADINNIPAPLIERIDVVTGGASAVYGSDAIAGVVNFVLKRDFEGVRAGATYSTTTRGDAGSYALDLTLGRSFAGERGNVTLFVGWTERDSIDLTARPYSKKPISSIDGSAFGSFTDSNGTLICSPLCQDPGGFPPTDAVSFQPNRDLAPFADRFFNFFPYAYFVVPEQRVQSMLLARFDVSDSLSAYGRASVTSTTIRTAIAPTGSFGSELAFPLDNPFWTSQALRVFADRDGDGAFDQFDVNGVPGIQPADFVGPLGEPGDQGDVGTVACPACAGNSLADPGELIRAPFYRRLSELGRRHARLDSLTYQVLVGLRGELGWMDGWSWDLSYQYGHADLTRAYRNDASESRVQDSLNGCPAGSAPGCVAGNFFGENTLDAPTTAFIQGDGIAEDIATEQQVLGFSLSGDLGPAIALPGANPIGLAFGAEWRGERSSSDPSSCYATPGCSLGYGSVTAVSSEFQMREVFGELSIPLAERRRFAHDVRFEAGARYADDSISKSSVAYKLGGSWAPNETLRLRAMFQRAVRAPNIFEFGSTVKPDIGLAFGDPCAAFNFETGGTTVTAELRDLCVATGAPASAFTPLPSGDFATAVPDLVGGEVNTIVGGNRDLDEERADTLTAGFVYEPDWLAGATFELDWYRIDIRDAIALIASDETLGGCYGDPSRPALELCRLVSRNSVTGGLIGDSRDPNTGMLVGLDRRPQNTAKLLAEGIDLRGGAPVEIGGFGELDISLLATYVLARDQRTSSASSLLRCQGKFGSSCGEPNPPWRFTQRTTWRRGDYQLGYRWRYVGPVELDEQTFDFDGDGIVDFNACLPRYCDNGSQHYVDLVFEWEPSEIAWLAGFELTLGLENIFDEDPPITGAAWGPTDANTFPGTYDPLGRTVTLSVSKQF